MRRIVLAAYLTVLTLFAVIALTPSYAIAEDAMPLGMMKMGDVEMIVSTSGYGQGVLFMVTDPQGRRHGFDPRTDEAFAEFDASFEPGVAPHYATERYENGLTFTLELTGEYAITVIGDIKNAYHVGVTVRRFDEGTRKFLEKGFYLRDFHVDKGITTTFKVKYNGRDAIEATTFEKVATVESLRQDLKLYRDTKTGEFIVWEEQYLKYLIDNDGVLKSLLQKLDAVEASIAKGNKTAARNQIDAFMNEVAAQAGKHIEDTTSSDPDDLSTAKRLLHDAQYLKDHL